MQAYERDIRLAPRWTAGVVAGLALAAIGGLLRLGWWSLAAGAPLLGLAVYGALVLYRNVWRLRVDAAGLVIGSGPLWVGPVVGRIAVEEVAGVYVRWAPMPGRPAPAAYLAAGVEHVDGRWIDVTDPMMAEVAVWREAQAVAAALGTGFLVEERKGMPGRIDWTGLRQWGCWAGLTAVAVGWAVLVAWIVGR